MTTVSMPAFERVTGTNAVSLISFPNFFFIFVSHVNRAHANRIVNLIKHFPLPNRQSLMGVAAIDVPLFEFERLFQSYRSGVGGYAFVIDQNGNILTHPDFRPLVSVLDVAASTVSSTFLTCLFCSLTHCTQFQKNILKPAFNSLDMSEVELMDDGYKAREFHPKLLEVSESLSYCGSIEIF